LLYSTIFYNDFFSLVISNEKILRFANDVIHRTKEQGTVNY